MASLSSGAYLTLFRPPSQELSRRLGRERCWRVVWPTTATEVPGSEFMMPAAEVCHSLPPKAYSLLLELTQKPNA
jgi:hypothetical protein